VGALDRFVPGENRSVPIVESADKSVRHGCAPERVLNTREAARVAGGEEVVSASATVSEILRTKAERAQIGTIPCSIYQNEKASTDIDTEHRTLTLTLL
jgi:hypothetical protein